MYNRDNKNILNYITIKIIQNKMQSKDMYASGTHNRMFKIITDTISGIWYQINCYKKRCLQSACTCEVLRQAHVIQFIVECVPTISIVDAERHVTRDAVPAGFYPVTTAGCHPGHTAMLTHSPPFGMQAFCHVQHGPYQVSGRGRISHFMFHIVRFRTWTSLYNDR